MSKIDDNIIQWLQDGYLISKADYLYYRIFRIWADMCSYYDFVVSAFNEFEAKDELEKVDNNIEVFEILKDDVNNILEEIKEKTYKSEPVIMHSKWFEKTWDALEKNKKIFETMLEIMDSDKFRLKNFENIMEY